MQPSIYCNYHRISFHYEIEIRASKFISFAWKCRIFRALQTNQTFDIDCYELSEDFFTNIETLLARLQLLKITSYHLNFGLSTSI